MASKLRSAVGRMFSTPALRPAYEFARSHGYTSWQPLVSLEGFSRVLDDAIAMLGAGAFRDGAYLEFGVSRGTSMLGASQAFERAGIAPRMIGFDSFQGMPKGSESEGWKTGEFASTKAATLNYLKMNGAALDRIRLVKGWFDDTLNPETRAGLGITSAPIVMVDCDIYSASKQVLEFCYPLLPARSVIIFDDWGPMERVGKVGQKEAFAEYLDAHPDLSATPFGQYDYRGEINGYAFVVDKADRM